MRVWRTKSEEETVALGRELARILPARGVVSLVGDLGAGKTTLVKGIASGCGAAGQEEVSSPTFTLIHEYGDPVRVYHVDLYRLDSAAQAAAIGLDELFDSTALVLIEWGDRFPELLPEPRHEIRIERAEGGERILRLLSVPEP